MDAKAKPARKVVFASDDLPADLDDAERFALWRDIYCARHGGAELVRQSDRPFSARSEFRETGEIGLTRFEVTLARWARTAQQAAVDARDDFLIGFNRNASGVPPVGWQRGREVTLKPGHAVFYTVGEAGETRAKPRPY